MQVRWNWVAHVTFSTIFFFGTLLGSMYTATRLVAAGYHEALVVAGLTLVVGVFLMLVARVWTFNKEWNGWGKVLGLDLLHAALSTVGSNALVQALTFGLMFEIARRLTEAVGWSIWPGELPLVAQVMLGILIADFGFYWVHRFFHQSKRFWPIHAIHHSSDRMYVLASSRNHPLNSVTTYMVQVAPLILIGTPIGILLLVSIFISVMGVIQHSNINLRLGVLDFIFSTPRIHRLHHSINEVESNHNYSSNLVFWDLVFGTYCYPRRTTLVVGLEGWDEAPNFFRHLAYPFRSQEANQPRGPL